VLLPIPRCCYGHLVRCCPDLLVVVVDVVAFTTFVVGVVDFVTLDLVPFYDLLLFVTLCYALFYVFTFVALLTLLRCLWLLFLLLRCYVVHSLIDGVVVGYLLFVVVGPLPCYVRCCCCVVAPLLNLHVCSARFIVVVVVVVELLLHIRCSCCLIVDCWVVVVSLLLLLYVVRCYVVTLLLLLLLIVIVVHLLFTVV